MYYQTTKTMTKKFELTNETFYDECVEARVYRIKALRDFGDVKAGDLGGFVEEESNLSHDGTCWIYDNAIVCRGSKVSEEAEVRDTAVISDESYVWGNSRIYETPIVRSSRIRGGVVHGDAVVHNADVLWRGEVKDTAYVTGGVIRDGAVVADNAHVSGNSYIDGYDTTVGRNASIADGNVYYTTDYHVFGGHNGIFVTWLRDDNGFVIFHRKYNAKEFIEYARSCGGVILTNAISAIAGAEAMKLQTNSNKQDNE